MIINVDSTGSTINLRYQYASGCQAQSLSMIKSDTADTWYSVTVLGNAITITVSDNSSSETPRSGSVTPYIESIGDICTSNTIEIFQYGNVVCECKDMVIDLFAIPVSGVSANSKIGTYGFYGERCSSLTIEGVIKEIENKTTIATLAFSNGEIFVNSAIPENTSDSFKEFDVEITYDGRPCASYHLSQEGREVQCDCEHIRYFIDERNVYFGVNGSWNEKVLIASADTHGCGSLSATVNTNSIFSADTIYEHISPNGHEYSWSAIVNSYDDARISEINIYFKKRDEPFFSTSCMTHVTVSCGPDYEFYTCNLIRYDYEQLLPQYIFVENFYDESICFNAGAYQLTVSSFNNTRVRFVPRLINDTTQSYLDNVKNQYINIPYDASGVELKTDEKSFGSYSKVRSTGNVISVSPSNSARKFYFAIDCYVNDSYCFTREGIFVANQSITSVTKCDLIDAGLRLLEKDEYGSFAGWGCGSSAYDYATYQIKHSPYYGFTADTTPDVFKYGTNGKDIQGENHWEEIPDIFGDWSYRHFLEESIIQKNSANTFSSGCVNTSCITFNNLPFNENFMPKIKILDTGFTSSTNWEFEKIDGEYTNRVRLIKGDTENGYLKEWMDLGSDGGDYFAFEDDAGEQIDCMGESCNLNILLRACESQEHVDNLDYSSCSALSAHISGNSSHYALIFDDVAHEAWLAFGDIRGIEFLCTMPHEEVILSDYYNPQDTVATNIYWDDPDLGARIDEKYYEGSKNLVAELVFNREIILDFVAGLCSGRCDDKTYYIQLPSTAATITAFTINNLTCSTELYINSFATYRDFSCSSEPSCNDITNVVYTIPVTNYTFDASATIEIGTFVGTFSDTAKTFDNYSYTLSYYVDEGAAIPSFTFDFTLHKIYMTFADSSYKAPSAQKWESFVLKAQYYDCQTNKFEDCINTNFTFFLTNLPT